MIAVTVTESNKSPQLLNTTMFEDSLNFEEISKIMEMGHKAQKHKSKQKWEKGEKLLSYNPQTQQLFVSTLKKNRFSNVSKQALDLSLIKEIATFYQKTNALGNKWIKDESNSEYSNEQLLGIKFGNEFIPQQWILKFESKEICCLWFHGIVNLLKKYAQSSDYIKMEEWLKKWFSILFWNKNAVPPKYMKPFVSIILQKKVQETELYRITRGKIENFDGFKIAMFQLLNYDALFHKVFSSVIRQNCSKILITELTNFFGTIQKNNQMTEENIAQIFKNYWDDSNIVERNPFYLACEEFIDYLFSTDNSVFDPINKTVINDMTQPLTNYWIASSFHTFLTGNQMTSKSSLDAYSNVLLMGCRGIDIACWDGSKKYNGDPIDIVIYHGYTFTSKLKLRNVLCTIRDYAFVTSEYPVILSIENYCSLPFQKLMAKEIKQIFGDLLLTSPLLSNETQLPSPEALKKKILIKHRKLRPQEAAPAMTRVTSELSDLAIYCQATLFNPNFLRETKFQEMCSLSETRHDKFIEMGLALFNTRHLSRVFPSGFRVDSSNYSPMPMWNTGCQMVALNYQTPDKPMQLNHGKFQANGRCGYILKPTYLMDPNFRFDNPGTVVGNCPINLKITIISGRFLFRNDKCKANCSPFIDIEILGMPFDDKSFRTTSNTANGLNPIWYQTFIFKLVCPEMALIRFQVEDGDFVGGKRDPFIGQAVFPVNCLRGGYRSVPLLNKYNESQDLSALLVYIEIENIDLNIRHTHEKTFVKNICKSNSSGSHVETKN